MDAFWSLNPPHVNNHKRGTPNPKTFRVPKFILSDVENLTVKLFFRSPWTAPEQTKKDCRQTTASAAYTVSN